MSDLLDQVLQTLQSQDYLEYTGLIFGILYIFLAAQNKAYCWIFGIISCFTIAIKDFTDYQLYSDGILQSFYVVMGFIGLYIWKFGGEKKKEKQITQWDFKNHLPYLAGIIAATAILFFVFDTYTNAAFPFLDALTTSLSVFATFLLVLRIWDNWIYWIVADLIYIYLYWSQEAYFFSLLMILYTVVAFYGLIKWRKELLV